MSECSDGGTSNNVALVMEISHVRCTMKFYTENLCVEDSLGGDFPTGTNFVVWSLQLYTTRH